MEKYCCIIIYMQLTKLYAYSFSFPFSYSSVYLVHGSMEVRDIHHTINRSIRYSLIYIFEYGMYRELGLSFVLLLIRPNVLAWDKFLILY
ncbi:hypothetical protein F383_26752 [Gossypium arboreum]|uniref:Uncharacterized protein n=1 Tax=Gossypium arboreum TaxID=29729 RepID=A0A0B0P3T7_GOSAR|nr:hypothetical protein F383_26752 [Gossypium arboreum]